MRMVHIGHMRMRMAHCAVLVSVRVWFARRITSLVGVPVVDVVHVRMRVHEGLVKMLVLVTLCQVQPNAERHQGSRQQKLRSYRVAQ